MNKSSGYINTFGVEFSCSRCGECCKSFPLSVSYEDTELAKKAFAEGDKNGYENSQGQRRGFGDNSMEWLSRLSPTQRHNKVEEHPETSEYRKSTLFWYSCGFLEEEHQEDGTTLYSCSMHERRPYACKGFLPSPAGGYLKDIVDIIYKDCSYIPQWRMFIERRREAKKEQRELTSSEVTEWRASPSSKSDADD